MKIFSTILFLSFTISTYSVQIVNASASQTATQDSSGYGKFVPVILGIHNEHEKPDSVKIELIDTFGSVAFFHQGLPEGWGMRPTGRKVKTGNYTLLLTWYNDNKMIKTKKDIQIKPETVYFSINIELANDYRRGRVFNAIYLDQYTNSMNTVEFTRRWDPMQQFKKSKILLPEYEVTNRNDSTLYGAYLRYSSVLSINWVQPHDIAFMRFENKTGNDWVTLNCNAPRMEMKLKKGATGKTLKDMVLGCEVSTFKAGRLYRIRIDYMINNAIYEKSIPGGGYEGNVYVGQTIYMYTDEFKL